MALDGRILQQFDDLPHAVNASVVPAADLHHSVSALGATVGVDLDASPSFIPELLDFEATLADDAAGLALVDQHAEVCAFALALDAGRLTDPAFVP